MSFYSYGDRFDGLSPFSTWQHLLKGMLLFRGGGGRGGWGGQWQKTRLTKKRLAGNSEQGGNT